MQIKMSLIQQNEEKTCRIMFRARFTFLMLIADLEIALNQFRSDYLHGLICYRNSYDVINHRAGLARAAEIKLDSFANDIEHISAHYATTAMIDR